MGALLDASCLAMMCVVVVCLVCGSGSGRDATAATLAGAGRRRGPECSADVVASAAAACSPSLLTCLTRRGARHGPTNQRE